MSENELMPFPTDDGWQDAANETAGRLLRGTILLFADWIWTSGKNKTRMPDGTRFAALATVALWVRWENNKPVEHRVRQPGRALPDREELDHSDETLWELDRDGKPQDPWRNSRYVYLVKVDDAAAYTFCTSSGGGRSAVADLGDQITRMRTVYPDAQPIVELAAEAMLTKYGRKSKPLFKIIGWKTASGEPVERQITAQTAAETVYRSEIDDEIPFALAFFIISAVAWLIASGSTLIA